jgi:hypothetical protein
MCTFFGFNGTGGVWRRTALEGAGGWNMDSTVEDMDLSIRAYVQGWKFRCGERGVLGHLNAQFDLMVAAPTSEGLMFACAPRRAVLAALASMEHAPGWLQDGVFGRPCGPNTAPRYLDWVHCPNELPPTLSAYKTQQFRWNSGPMVVLKQMLATIWTTDKVNFFDRLSCSYFFFRYLFGPSAGASKGARF